MEVLVVLLLLVGSIVSITVGSVAYCSGSDTREKEIRWSTLYGSDCYENRFVAPFNFLYDMGYAAYDKRTLRAEHNKENFKRKSR